MEAHCRFHCGSRFPPCPSLNSPWLSSWLPALLNLAEEPCAGESPAALDGADRYFQLLRRLLLCQADKETEFYDLGGAWINCFQLSERLIQRQQIIIGQWCSQMGFFEINALQAAASFEPL